MYRGSWISELWLIASDIWCMDGVYHKPTVGAEGTFACIVSCFMLRVPLPGSSRCPDICMHGGGSLCTARIILRLPSGISHIRDPGSPVCEGKINSHE